MFNISDTAQSSGSDSVMSSLQPVQGQRRGEAKTRKAKKPVIDNRKDKANCKQQ